MGDYKQGLKAKSDIELQEELTEINFLKEALKTQTIINAKDYNEKMEVLNFRQEAIELELSNR